MAGRVPFEIERLLAEAGSRLDAPERELLRARLAASLAQGLDSPSGADRRADDLAGLAAFLDGQLTDTEREAFILGLVEAPGRRAELDSAAALLDAVGDGAPVSPKLLTQATAEFAPPPATSPAMAAPRVSWWAHGRLGTPRIRVAVTAVVALAVLVPAIAMVGTRFQQAPAKHQAPAPLSAAPAWPALQVETPQFEPPLGAASSRGDFLGAKQPGPAANVSAPAQPAGPTNEPACDTPEGLVASRARSREVSVVQSRKEARSLLREDPCRPADAAARPRLIVPAAPPAALAAPPAYR
ncbi:MAG: hypothetical protein ACLPKB_19230 [Xanthobacteraceae bacterium]